MCGASFPCGNAHIDEVSFDVAAICEQNAADDSGCDGRGVEVGAAFEAMAGVGVQAVAARGAADGHGFKPCGLDEDVLCVRGDHRVPTTHNPGEAEGFNVVGYDEVVGIEDTVHAV